MDKTKLVKVLIVVMLVAIIILLCVIIFQRKPSQTIIIPTDNDTVIELQHEVDSLNDVIANIKQDIVVRDSVRTIVITKYDTIYKQIEMTDDLAVLDSIIMANL